MKLRNFCNSFCLKPIKQWIRSKKLIQEISKILHVSLSHQLSWNVWLVPWCFFSEKSQLGTQSKRYYQMMISNREFFISTEETFNQKQSNNWRITMTQLDMKTLQTRQLLSQNGFNSFRIIMRWRSKPIKYRLISIWWKKVLKKIKNNLIKLKVSQEYLNRSFLIILCLLWHQQKDLIQRLKQTRNSLSYLFLKSKHTRKLSIWSRRNTNRLIGQKRYLHWRSQREKHIRLKSTISSLQWVESLVPCLTARSSEIWNQQIK